MGFFDKIFKAKELEKSEPEPMQMQDWRGQKRGFCKFEVRGSYQIPALGTVIVGMVSEGLLKPGLSFDIRAKNGKVKTIERNHSQVQEAGSGQLVSVVLEGVTKQDILPGDKIEFY